MNPKNYRLTAAQVKAELLKHTFLDPRYDATFKILIADEEHPERLVHFLNAMLRLEGEQQIVSAVLQGTEQEVIFGYEKKVVFDIACRNEKGEPIIVEMQRSGDDSFKDRMLYYAAVAIKKEITSGTVEYELPRVYILALMNFCFDEHPKEHHHTVKLVNVEHGGVFYDKLTFVYVELPKFRKEEDELQDDEDRWFFALGCMGEVSERPEALSGPIFEALFDSAKIAKLESMKIDQLSNKLADEGIRNGEMAYATRKGREEGLEQGIGIGELRNKIQMVETMLGNGIPWETITKGTGLTPEALDALKKQFIAT